MQDDGERQVEGHAASNNSAEHRREHRRRTLKQARVVLSDWVTVDCKVRDITGDGAHLVFGGAVSLPESFRLHNVSDSSIAPVKLQWQRGLEAGVSFTGPQEPLSALKPPGAAKSAG